MSSEGLDLSAGTALGGCIIEEQLGRGGMGVVFRARQHALKRMVALKVIDPVVEADPEMRDRFLREARIAAEIEHANVLPLYDIGLEAGHLFIVMRYVESGDLETFLEERSLSTLEVRQLVDQIASALDAAHAAGLVHRDVKPQNILVDATGGELHCYLTDFGLARRVGDMGLTLPGVVLGTPWYMSPEQALGQPVDARTDIYALGCVLFQLLARQVPYPESELAAVLAAHQLAPVPSVTAVRPDLPKEIDHVVERALAKDREERFPSAGDLARAATHALTGEPAESFERSVATGEAELRELFPDPTPDFIHTQCPRMTAARFEAFLGFLRERNWAERDIRELVHPWGPRAWKQSTGGD